MYRIYFLLIFFLSIISCNKNYNNNFGCSSSGSSSKVNTSVLADSSKEYDVAAICPTDVLLGSKDANVNIVFIFSTTCPGCSIVFNNIITKLKKDFVDKDEVLIVLRDIITSDRELCASILARSCDSAEDYFKLMHIILSNQRAWVIKRDYYKFFCNVITGYLGSKDLFNKNLADIDLRNRLLKSSYNLYKNFHMSYYPLLIIDGEVYDLKNYKNYHSLKKFIKIIVDSKKLKNSKQV